MLASQHISITNCSGINSKRFSPPKQNHYERVYNAHFDRRGGTQKPATGASQGSSITHNLTDFRVSPFKVTALLRGTQLLTPTFQGPSSPNVQSDAQKKIT